MTKTSLLGPWVRRFLLWNTWSPNATWPETPSAVIGTRFVCCFRLWLNRSTERD